MTVSYFTHVRCLGDGSADNAYRANLEFIPEIDALLLFINNRAACVDMNGQVVLENTGHPRWSNQTLVARNKHIAVVYVESDDADFANQIASFTAERPVRPHGFDWGSYVSNVEYHKNWLINSIEEIDENFDINNIRFYIENLSFLDIDYISIQNWMLSTIDNNFTLFPDTLINNNLWNLESFNRLYLKYISEGPYADIKKLFKAFEIYTMNCILEVI